MKLDMPIMPSHPARYHTHFTSIIPRPLKNKAAHGTLGHAPVYFRDQHAVTTDEKGQM